MHRAAVLLAAALAACGSRGPSAHLDVDAFAGERAEPGAAVISHTADGVLIDQTTADAVGHASIGVDPDALVTVFFPGTISEDTPVVTVVTVPAPADKSPLSIHGPAHGPPPQSIGVLRIVPAQPLAGVDHFEVDVGCALIRTTSLPADLDIGARCGGTDANLDVLVLGYADQAEQMLAGYAAGRVPMVDGIAELDPTAWSTGGMQVPVVRDGVAADVTWTLFADTLPFTTALLADAGTLPDGLAVDAVRVKTEIAGVTTAQITTREYASVPAEIRITADDFLPPLTNGLITDTANPPAVHWDAASLGDAIDVRFTWLVSTHLVIWDAVLPPTATSISFPALQGDLAVVAALPAGTMPDARLRYVDSDQLDGYPALLAAGIYAMQSNEPSTIAPRPTTGEIRATQSVGLRP